MTGPPTVTEVDSGAEYRQFKIFVDVYLVSFLCVFGITGNLVSVAVLRRDRVVRSTTGFLLIALAFTDCLYLTTCLFFQTLNTVSEFTDWLPGLRFYWPYIAPYVWPSASIAQTCAVWLVLVVTTDRYIAICKPLHAPVYSTTRRMRKVVLTVWTLCILYNLPRFFERHVVQNIDPNTNATIPSVEKTSLRNNPIYVLVYKTLLFFIVRFCIPISFLTFFNIRLIQAIRASYRKHRNLPGESQMLRKGEKYSLTLVVIVLCFIICETPDFILRIWISMKEYNESTPYPKQTLKYVNAFSNVCLTINSCSNFVIYCFIGKRFRMILTRLLCNKKGPRYNMTRKGTGAGSYTATTRPNYHTVNGKAYHHLNCKEDMTVFVKLELRKSKTVTTVCSKVAQDEDK